jgi:spore maturation protein CgeB
VRILAVEPGPYFSVQDVHRGWVAALRDLGVVVVDFNMADRLGFYSEAGRINTDGAFLRMVDDHGAVRLASKGLEAACYEFQPDMLLVTSCFYIPLDTLDLIRTRGTKVVILHTEEPYEHERQLVRGEHADLNILNDPVLLADWPAATEYFPHAYNPAVHRPGPAKPDCRSEFCFVGTAYPGRIQFFEQVDFTGVDVALAGNWRGLTDDSPLRKFVAHNIDHCCDNTETVDLYRGADMSANLYRTEADEPELLAGWAMGPREVELAACGTFFLTEARGENREVLPMVPTFSEPGEFGELLRWYLARPDQRQTIAAAARAAVADRTFENNARRLLTLLERL